MFRVSSYLLVVFLFAQTLNLAIARETTHQWGGTVYADVEGVAPENVWPFIGDFCNVYMVFPINVSFCDRGDPQNVTIGTRRFMVFLADTGVQWEKHHLVEFDQVKRVLTYRMMENNIKVSYYRSTMSVLKGKKGGSVIRWKWIANPVEGYTKETMQARLQWIVLYAAGNIMRLSCVGDHLPWRNRILYGSEDQVSVVRAYKVGEDIGAVRVGAGLSCGHLDCI